MVRDIRFKVKTKNGMTIHTTEDYWQRIVTTKHPSIAKYEKQVKEALENPDEIRRSQQDERAYIPSEQVQAQTLGSFRVVMV